MNVYESQFSNLILRWDNYQFIWYLEVRQVATILTYFWILHFKWLDFKYSKNHKHISIIFQLYCMKDLNSARHIGHLLSILSYLEAHSLQIHIWRQGVRIIFAGFDKQIEHSSSALHLYSVSAPYISNRLNAKLLHYINLLVPAKTSFSSYTPYFFHHKHIDEQRTSIACSS